MSIVPLQTPNFPKIRPEGRKPRWLLASFITGLILLLLLSSFFWIRLRRIQDQLQASSQRIEGLATKQEVLNGDLMRSREETETARQQTKAALDRAAKAEQAQAQAAQQTVEAQAAKATADQQNLRAQEEVRTAREELDQIRKNREAELNRMQEALSKVAATRRTDDGMVIDLTNDSFKFDFDKSTLRPQNRELLSRLAGILLVSHGYRLHIYGYTDDIGTDQYNQSLSERRAQAVDDYLARSGVPADIMNTRGFGKSNPRVKATSLEAREKNRRVEIAIVDTVIKYSSAQAQ